MKADPIVAEQAPYWCFISYRHADNREQDRTWASWLHQEIERYEVPAELIGQKNARGDIIPERIYPVFRDEESLPADSDLAHSIVNALNRSRFLVVLCSPKAVQSRYVGDEIHHFKRKGGDGRIIAAIVDGEPGSPRECFPESLRHPVGPDGELNRSVNVEPIAADFRLKDGNEGFTSAEAYRLSLRKDANLANHEVEARAERYGAQLQLMKLKIIAGILGVPLERLRDRDKAYQLQLAQNRARTLRRWLVAVATLAVVAIGSGLFALVEQQRAVAAQRRTVTEMLNASWKAATFFVEQGSDAAFASFQKTRTYIFGTRALYNHLRLFMDLSKLQSLSPVPVFLSGPHATGSAGNSGPANRDFNFKSYDFGRYNPKFIQWAVDNAIPAAEDETLRRITQPFYDKFLREMSRYYYIVYLDIQAQPRIRKEVVPRFLRDIEKFRKVPFDDKAMGAGPGGYLQNEVFYNYADQFGRFNPQGKLVTLFPWSSGQLDSYYPNVAGAFWVRRMVDETHDAFADLLRKLLSTYDRKWLSTAPEAKPSGERGARRFSIKF